jgi:NAD(P)H-hydrate epimerase
VAVDIPSGLDCNTGQVLGVAVQADLTVTFALPKQGFFVPGAENYTGKVTVVDISIPRELLS